MKNIVFWTTFIFLRNPGVLNPVHCVWNMKNALHAVVFFVCLLFWFGGFFVLFFFNYVYLLMPLVPTVWCHDWWWEGNPGLFLSLSLSLFVLQLDEKASLWCTRPAWRCLQIQRTETTLRSHRTEVATQTYHIQVVWRAWTSLLKYTPMMYKCKYM